VVIGYPFALPVRSRKGRIVEVFPKTKRSRSRSPRPRYGVIHRNLV